MEREGFRVELRLMAADGRELAKARGSGKALYQAAHGALDALAGSGDLPKAKRLEGNVARWSWAGVDDVDLALAYFDWGESLAGGTGLREERDRLAALRTELGLLWPQIDLASSLSLGEPLRRTALPPAAGSTAHDRMRRGLAVAKTDPGADAVALADELAAATKQSHLEGRSSTQPRDMSGNEGGAALKRGEGLA